VAREVVCERVSCFLCSLRRGGVNDGNDLVDSPGKGAVERSFLLPVEGFVISGRIDAIYGTDDGPWEVVDYKTGRRPTDDDELTRTQLDVYALACIDVWGKRPEDLTLTYLYLASGDEVSHSVDDEQAIRQRIGRWLRGIGEAAYEPTPGPQCRWCDFRPFCDAGRAWLERADRP